MLAANRRYWILTVEESPGPLTSQIHDEILHGTFCCLDHTEECEHGERYAYILSF
jgi:hypothetical protein